jgi:hypothetical protein
MQWPRLNDGTATAVSFMPAAVALLRVRHSRATNDERRAGRLGKRPPFAQAGRLCACEPLDFPPRWGVLRP